MIQGICTRVYDSPTTTPEAKALAAKIAGLAKQPAAALKTRLQQSIIEGMTDDPLYCRQAL